MTVYYMGVVNATSSDISNSNTLTGSGTFTSSGTIITHNLGNVEHSTIIVPSGEGDFDVGLISGIGTVYVKRGDNEDTVYKTGDETADGLPFTFIISL